MPRYVQDLLASSLQQTFDLHHFNTTFSRRVRTQRVNLGHERYRGRQTLWRRYGYIFAGGGLSGLKTLAAGLWSILRFTLCLVQRRPDLVHVFANMNWGFWRAGTMVLIARVMRTRILFHPLGAIEKFYAGSGRVGRSLITFMLDAADVVVLQSPGLARQVAAFTRRPTLGIFNGIDLAPFTAMAAARGQVASIRNTRFLAVGDLGHNKGTWDILAAAGRTLDEAPGSCWTFIGRGDLDDVARRAQQTGVKDHVQFLGAATEEEKLHAFEESDVLLLPSYAEGQPLSILEAMAAGLPVISTPVGSIAEVIGEENGILVQPGDVDALAGAMIRLAGDPALRARMSLANRRAAERRFDARRLWHEIGATWSSILEERRG